MLRNICLKVSNFHLFYKAFDLTIGFLKATRDATSDEEQDEADKAIPLIDSNNVDTQKPFFIAPASRIPKKQLPSTVIIEAVSKPPIFEAQSQSRVVPKMPTKISVPSSSARSSNSIQLQLPKDSSSYFSNKAPRAAPKPKVMSPRKPSDDEEREKMILMFISQLAADKLCQLSVTTELSDEDFRNFIQEWLEVFLILLSVKSIHENDGK